MTRRRSSAERGPETGADVGSGGRAVACPRDATVGPVCVARTPMPGRYLSRSLT